VTRARVICVSDETPEGFSVRTVVFRADTDSPEGEKFTRYTPSLDLRMAVDNPGVVFEPGKAYYLDFTPAAEKQPETTKET
jgi:hypothetical protein